MSDPVITKLWVDVETHDAEELRDRLAMWTSTVSISSYSAPYTEDRSYSRFALDTTLTEDQVDQRLWERCSLDWVGVAERRNYKKSDGYIFSIDETILANEL